MSANSLCKIAQIHWQRFTLSALYMYVGNILHYLHRENTLAMFHTALIEQACLQSFTQQNCTASLVTFSFICIVHKRLYHFTVHIIQIHY